MICGTKRPARSSTALSRTRCSGNTARTSTISVIHRNRPVLRARPAPNEAPRAGVRGAGIVTSPGAEPGRAAPAGWATTTLSARSICTRSVLVPSRISVLLRSEPGKGGVGQTRLNIVQVSQRLNHTLQACFPWEQALPGSLSLSKGRACHSVYVVLMEGSFCMYPYRPPIPYGKRTTRVFVGVAFLGLVLILTANSSPVIGGVGVALCTGVVSAALVIDWAGVITLRGLFDWQRIRGVQRLGLVVAWICLFPVFFCLYLIRVAVDQSGLQRPPVAPACVPGQARTALLVGSLVVSIGVIAAFGSANDPSSLPAQSRVFTRTSPAPVSPGLSSPVVLTAVPTVSATPSPTPVPRSTLTPVPRSTPTPGAHCVAVNHNPWCDNFQHGHLLYKPQIAFCTYFRCVSSFWQNTRGYVDECKDGAYSHSGGRSGDCTHHGGPRRPLYSH
jgi:hypothetical protein